MSRYDIIRCRLQRLRHIFQIDAVFAAIGDRNTPAPRACFGRDRTLRQGQQLFTQCIEAELDRIVMHQQRSVGRHRFGYASDGLVRDGLVEREYPPVCHIVDVLAEFDRDGAVAAG
jgi:hypothetical protein